MLNMSVFQDDCIGVYKPLMLIYSTWADVPHRVLVFVFVVNIYLFFFKSEWRQFEFTAV